MTDPVFLLDANVLIALATPEHSLNSRAAAWFRLGHRFATCPITQGALIRFHLRSGAGASMKSAKSLLEMIASLPRHTFWPDTATYLELPERGIFGHRQVTDAYLVTLAGKQGGILATLDRSLASVHPGTLLIEG